MDNYLKNVGSVLISSEQIASRIDEIATRINNDYKDSESLVIVGILKGSFIFLADLIRKIKLPVTVEFIGVSSYRGSSSTGQVKIKIPFTGSVMGKDVLVVEDIVDTGVTLSYLNEIFKEEKASSVKICALLSKPSCRKVQVNVDYTGFEIGDEFIIGYGLDYDGRYRNLPYVAVYEPESNPN